MKDERDIPIWACPRWGSHEHDWLDCYLCLDSYDKLMSCWDIDPPTASKAIAVAQVVHAGDKRDLNGEPYINHCLRVMSTVMLHPELRGDEEAAMIAALHDTVEDHPERIAYVDIENLFGQAVMLGVCDLTNVYTHAAYPTINRAGRKLLERERWAPLPQRSKIIKMLDIQDNLRSCYPMNKESAKFAKVFATEKIALLEMIGDAYPPTYHRVLELAHEVLECASYGGFTE